MFGLFNHIGVSARTNTGVLSFAITMSPTPNAGKVRPTIVSFKWPNMEVPVEVPRKKRGELAPLCMTIRADRAQ